jgi:hypothetical protein
MEQGMSILIFALRILGLLWSLPLSIAGLVVARVFKAYSPMRRGFVLEFAVPRLPGPFKGLTVGHVQLYREDADRARVRRHEDVHTLQGDLLGVFDPLLYGLAYAVIYAWYRSQGGSHAFAKYRAYRHNPMELWAREASR